VRRAGARRGARGRLRRAARRVPALRRDGGGAAGAPPAPAPRGPCRAVRMRRRWMRGPMLPGRAAVPGRRGGLARARRGRRRVQARTRRAAAATAGWARPTPASARRPASVPACRQRALAARAPQRRPCRAPRTPPARGGARPGELMRRAAAARRAAARRSTRRWWPRRRPRARTAARWTRCARACGRLSPPRGRPSTCCAPRVRARGPGPPPSGEAACSAACSCDGTGHSGRLLWCPASGSHGVLLVSASPVDVKSDASRHRRACARAAAAGRPATRHACGAARERAAGDTAFQVARAPAPQARGRSRARR